MSKDYSASSILSLSRKDHLKQNLHLTFGAERGSEESPYSTQKQVAVSEIYSNSIDEVLGKHGDKVKVSFFKDNSFEVYDNGRGLPVDVGQDSEGVKKSGIMLTLGTIQSSAKFSQGSDDSFSTGLHGVGASSTIVMSSRADITVYRNKKEYTLSFKDGDPGFFSGDTPDSKFTPLKDLTYVRSKKDSRPAKEKKEYPTGTKIRIWLDDNSFSSEYPYNTEDIIERLRSTAFLIPDLYLEVYSEQTPVIDPETGEEEPFHDFFHFDNGVNELVELLQSKERLTPVEGFSTVGKYVEKNVPVFEDNKFHHRDMERKVEIDVAFTYDVGYDFNGRSFVNTIHTHQDGVHLIGVQRAMWKAFNARFQTVRGLIKKDRQLPSIDDFMEGLSLVVSVKMHEPDFSSQTKERLEGREVQRAIENAMIQEFEKWIKAPKNKDTFDLIAKKVTTASENRQKAREQRELNRKKTALQSSTSLPAKLVDCRKAGTEEAELYIAEGNSALTSLKEARDSKLQALLPIRGQIINIFKRSEKAVLSNKEVNDMILTMDAGVGADFTLDNARYGKVFIATDEDPDGDAIAVSLIGLFSKIFPSLIEEGRLFKIQTPLFVIKTRQGKNSRNIYTQTEREKNKEVQKLEKENIPYIIMRIKGLGECPPEILAHTAMNPETRIVTQITIEKAEEMQKALVLALGNDANARKDWIQTLDYDEEDIAV